MPRRVEDIVPGSRRSIRDVSLGSRDVRITKPPEKVVEKKTKTRETLKDSRETRDTTKEKEVEITIHKDLIAPPLKEAPIFETKKPSKQSRFRGFVWLYITMAVLSLGAISYFASIYFARAVFTLTPREVPIAVDSIYTASASETTAPLTYKLMSITKSASSTVPATTGTAVSAKAEGTVTLYNSFTSQPWRLVAGTRLESENGNIYRLTQSVTIPKLTKSAAGATVPGMIKASVVSDKAGDDYNISVGDGKKALSVVAYADSTKYDTIYARITSPISGGFVGTKNTVKPATLTTTETALKSKILEEATSEMRMSIPEGFILYDQAIVSSFDDAVVSSAGTGMATVSMNGTVHGILLNKMDLISTLAGKTIVESFDGNDFDTIGLDKLTHTISNIKDFSPVKKNTLTIRFRGTMKLVGIIPVEDLKKRFAGIALSDTEGIIKSLSSVIDLKKSNNGQVVPPWARIPTDENKISIIVKE